LSAEQAVAQEETKIVVNLKDEVNKNLTIYTKLFALPSKGII